MKVYVCTDHDGHYPVGVASVVVAETPRQAAELLGVELREHGLDPSKVFTLREISLGSPKAFVLLDGDY